ncbi:hypothetical protein PHO31112_04457 [Pandoraea horticolens]|uniref:Uncharacterized protein n=1 Tax=Pandoraea horticolens TaxID=2508298 RepID=A0A5E4YE02_9BURK|nr:hypothetical protein [Pandoraea horticolens]VVE46914.1 hypothetical protein PHO31112_04457 [Pandoraea horticolens]
MDINACLPAGIASGRFSAAGAQREGAPPDTAPFAAFGPVTGHDGSGAPLPPVGPHDFSEAQPVHDVVPSGVSRETARLWLAPHAEAAQFVVRACPGARSAAQSWFASRLCGALGLATPTAFLVHGCSSAFDGTHAPERLYLATTYLPAYRALGQWLETDAAWRVIDGVRGGAGEACKQARAEAHEIGRLMAQRGTNAAQARTDAQAHAAIVKARNDRRTMLCRALPDVYQCALERHYIAALWLGNGNLCDAAMGNIGVWRDKNDLPYIMTVDFSACLGSGGQGEREGDGMTLPRGQAFASSEASRWPGLSGRPDASRISHTSHYGAVIPEGTLTDVTQFRHGEHCAPFARRLGALTPATDGKTVFDEMKDPTGVRALAAEMAYRLGRIGASDILPWAADAHDIAQAFPAGTGNDGSVDEPDSQVHRILSRRDCLVTLLGGTWAAQAWERLYPTRAAAIRAQQSPFLTPERNV